MTTFEIKEAHSSNTTREINRAKEIFAENVEKGMFYNAENVGIQFYDINSETKVKFIDLDDLQIIGEEVI